MSEGLPPSDDELLKQLEDELKTLKVSDLLVGYRRLSEQDRDLDQARLAIEALRALVPVLDGAASEELVRDFKQVTANLQLAYVDAAKGEG